MNHTHVAIVADGGRVSELVSRGVPGFEVEPIDGTELMARRALGIPVITSFAGTSPDQLAYYRLSNVVLSPSAGADRLLISAGVRGRRICRWQHAVDQHQFSPAHYSASAFEGAGDRHRVNLLYAGPPQDSPEADALLQAVRTAQDHDPRLHMVAAERPELPGAGADPAVYASADLLLCPGASDLYGQAIVEAQASGLAVLAASEGAAIDLIESGRSGCLVPIGTFAFAQAIRWLARRATLRERLATGGLLATGPRTWEASLRNLSDAWQASLSQDHGPAVRAA